MRKFRLRIGYLPFPESLYRVLMVPENITLDSLGYAILLAFEARCNKLYSYRFGKRKVVSRIDYPLAKSLDESYELDSECSLCSFGLEEGMTFSFFYGRGGDMNRHILDYYFENEGEDYLYSPLVGRKVKREDYFGFDFSHYDAKAGEKRLDEHIEDVRRNYREATPMLPCI